MEKIDFQKELKNMYTANSKIKEIDANSGNFLSLKGQSAPGKKKFIQAIEKIYPTIFTLKFDLKEKLKKDFKVSKLECLWFDDPNKVPDMNKWRWELFIRIPNFVTKNHLKSVTKNLLEKKDLDCSDIEIINFKESKSVQTIHLGKYEELGNTYEKLNDYITTNKLAINGPAHEIYLSDPRRVSPERLKTIVRFPIKK